MKILVVDDEPELADHIEVSFNMSWHDAVVERAASGESVLEIVEGQRPDLVLLDVAGQDIEAFSTLRRLREFSDVPVIILSTRSGVLDKVKGLELGADDYVTKPFDHLELVARVKALMRRLEIRPSDRHMPPLSFEDLTVDLANHCVLVRDAVVGLTNIEYKLLSTLARNAGYVLPHRLLLTRIWGPEYVEAIELLRVYIWRLRRKLEPIPQHPKYILTEPRVGYRFSTPT